jgi:hypothetical protein
MEEENYTTMAHLAQRLVALVPEGVFPNAPLS